MSEGDDCFNLNLQTQKNNDSDNEEEPEDSPMPLEDSAPSDIHLHRPIHQSVPFSRPQMQTQSNINQKTETVCSNCSKRTTVYDKFSCGTHIICEDCLYKKIFCHYLEDLTKNENGILIVKCHKCGLGEMKKSVEEIYEIVQRRIENLKNGVGNKKYSPSYNNCEKHPEISKNFYCMDCKTIVCSACVAQKGDPHSNHRIIKTSKIRYYLKKTIQNITLRFGDKNSFLQNLNLIGKNIQTFVEGQFFTALKTMDELISAAIAIRSEFERGFKEKLQSKMYLVKILKMFYMDYFINKDMALNDLSQNTDISLLQYLSDINQEFVHFNIYFDNGLNDKINGLKAKIDQYKQNLNSYFKYEYLFSKTSRSYIPDEIFPSVDNGKFYPVIAQAPNDSIITAGNFKMKIFEQMEQDNEIEYKQVTEIDKMVGNVFSMLILKDSRIVTAGDKADIKIWQREGRTYQMNQTLSGHKKIVITLSKFSDGRILSGSHDKTIIVWKPDENNFEIEQKLECEGEVLFVLGSLNRKYIFAAQPNGPILFFSNEVASSNAFFKPALGNHSSEEQSNENNNSSKEYVKKQILSQHKGKVWTICDLGNDYFATGGQNPRLAIWKLTNGMVNFAYPLKEHKAEVTGIVKLRDGTMASVSCDHTIKIWKMGNLKKFVLIENITESDKALFSLIQLKDERLCTISSSRNMIIWRNRPKYN
ncbi:MAG: hypothetical protein MJ252_16745 [archaeon]|nr:hypothetical protein [archaeon]